MRNTIMLLLLVWLLPPSVNACTTFFINKNGQLVFGRNYDWVTGNGMVCTNQRGLAKTSVSTGDGGTISWISQYGSITFNQYGKEFPTGGMNEKGLVVELMWLDGTKYPEADNRPALGVLQWIQYQLDNCSTIDDVIATDAKIRIASKGNTPLHYLVADGKGNAAAIEFLEGKMMVHRGKGLPFPVLTNNSYKESIAVTAPSVQSNGKDAVSFTDNSIDRFAKACNMVTQYLKTDIATPVIDYSFSILDKVAQGTHTKWSIVYDIANKKVYFKTLEYSQVKNVSFSSFDFTCAGESKTTDMNQSGAGDIASKFSPFSAGFNRRIVERSFAESVREFTVSEEGQRSTWEYPNSIACAQNQARN